MSYIASWRKIIKNLSDHRELIWQLYKRDHLAVHKRSFLGILWIFITPLVGIISWVFLKSTGILSVGNVGVPYPAYVLMGSSFWGLFMGFFTLTSFMIMSGSKIIMQVNFPREVLMVKQAMVQLTLFLISFVFNIIVLIIFGITPSIWIITIPLIILPVFFLASGLGLIVTLFSVVALDIKNVVATFVGLLLYASPIIYSNNVNNDLIQTIIKYNPITYLVCSARDVVLFGRLYEPSGFIICSVVSLLFFMITIRLFFVSEGMIIERILD